MGLKLCCVAWDSWGFVKKDKDRAPVIQSCVYTEIHTILTLTSLWRWKRHALIWNCLCFFRESVLFPVLFCLFWILLLKHNSRLLAKYPKTHPCILGSSCGMMFWWVIIVFTHILENQVALCHAAFNLKNSFIFIKQIKRQKIYFLAISFFSWAWKV